MIYEWYTTGGGSYMIPFLNAVAAFTDSSLMDSMARLAIVISIIWLSFQIIFNGLSRKLLQWFVVASIVWIGFVETKTRVLVVDNTNPFLTAALVDNVPWALGFWGAQISEVGRLIADQYTAFTSTPNAVAYQRNGFVFGADLLSQTTRYRIVDEYLSQSMTAFLEQCVLYGSLLNHISWQAVANTDDIVGALTGNLPQSAAFVNVTEAGGTVTTTTQDCVTGFADLVTRMEADIDRLLLKEATRRYPSTTYTNAVKVARLTEDLTGFQQFMIGNSVSARDRLRQGMMINGLNDSLTHFLSATGNNAAMTAYTSARVEAQRISSFQAVGASATKAVPFLKIAFEILYIGIFPIAAILMMTPLWPLAIKGYFLGFVWLASWETVSVFLHNMVLLASSGFYTGASTFVRSDGTAEAIISWANHLGVRSVEQDVAATAGYLSASAPFIAAGLVFGVGKLTGLATSYLNVGQGAAIETGREASTGSFSVANTQLDQHAANSLKTSTNVDQGRVTVPLQSGANLVINPNGQRAYTAGTSLSTSPSDIKLSEEHGQRVSEAREDVLREASSTVNTFSEGFATASRNFMDLTNAVRSDVSVGSGTNAGESSRDSDSVRQSLDRIDRVAAENGLTRRDMLTAGLATSAGLGVTIKGIGRLGSELNLKAEGSALSSDQFQKAYSVAEANNLASDIQTVQDYATSRSGSLTDSTGKVTNWGDQISIDKLQSSSRTTTDTIDRASSFITRSEMFDSESLSAGTALHSEFQNYLEHKHGTGERGTNYTSNVMNPRTEAHRAAREAELGQFLASIYQGMGVSAIASGSGAIVGASNPDYPTFASSPPKSSGGGSHSQGFETGNEWVKTGYALAQEEMSEQAFGSGTEPGLHRYPADIRQDQADLVMDNTARINEAGQQRLREQHALEDEVRDEQARISEEADKGVGSAARDAASKSFFGRLFGG